MSKLCSILAETQQRLKSYENNDEFITAFKIKKRTVCQFCQKDSHLSVNCWYNPKNKDRRPKWIKSNENDQNNELSFIANTAFTINDYNYKNIYYIDSGATKHFCNDRNAFIKFKEISPYEVSIGNNNPISEN